MSRIASVHAQLELRLVVPGGPDLPVLAGLRYTAADPWAVHVAFRTAARSGDGDDGSVEWVFARQLLTDGVRAPVGEGDVRVWPSGHDRVVLAMHSPSGSARFEIDRDALVEFLQRTCLAVPTGTECDVVDLGAELDLLLG